jgi:hypothetical protein
MTQKFKGGGRTSGSSLALRARTLAWGYIYIYLDKAFDTIYI